MRDFVDRFMHVATPFVALAMGGAGMAMLFVGCTVEAHNPPGVATPYGFSRTRLDGYSDLVTLDYEGRRHVFVGGGFNNPGAGIAKLGDYPIPAAKP